jgi:acetoin:2,6-dichlorophenolindophenol oxidoreductase subunit beta
VSYSGTMGHALAAAARLAEAGVSVEAIDLRTVSPWDRETVLASVEKTGRLVVAHEALRSFGVGAEIAATVQEVLFGRLKAPVQRVGAPTCPVPFSKPLETAFMPGEAAIAAAIRATMN